MGAQSKHRRPTADDPRVRWVVRLIPIIVVCGVAFVPLSDLYVRTGHPAALVGTALAGTAAAAAFIFMYYVVTKPQLKILLYGHP